MPVLGSFHHVLRNTLTVNRAQISLSRGLRNTVGIALPLAAGAALGQTIPAVTMTTGALTVSFSDLPGPHRVRVGSMLAAAGAGTISVMVGSLAGASTGLTAVLALVWGFWGGLLVALGPTTTQIGLTSIILFLIYGAFPLPADRAAEQGLLVLVGGLVQAALAAGSWPLRPAGPERDALVTVFRSLATLALSPPGQPGAPPASAEMTTAGVMLAGHVGPRGPEGTVLRALLDEAERIRLELLTLVPVGAEMEDVEPLETLRAAAARALDQVAGALMGGQVDELPMQALETAAEALSGPRTRAHADALVGQVRAALHIAAQGDVDVQERQGIVTGMWHALEDAMDTLRANLTLRSGSMRHALRLAGCLTVAVVAARHFGLARAYWVPMTAAIVLKPDFSATFARGIARIAGTLIGLALATALVAMAFGNLGARVVVVAVLALIIRTVGPANFGFSAISVTVLVVVLTSFAGAEPSSIIHLRGLDTVLGGALALVTYLLWPTWERSRAPLVLADMLDAYRRYAEAVMARWLHQGDEDILHRRLAARLARAEAEASVERLRDEPVRAHALDVADGVLTHSHRFIEAAMALEAALYVRDISGAPSVPLSHFARDVDDALETLAGTLRGHPAEPLPDLRRDFGDLRREVSTHASPMLAAVERMVNSLNTIAHVLAPKNPVDGDERAAV